MLANTAGAWLAGSLVWMLAAGAAAQSSEEAIDTDTASLERHPDRSPIDERADLGLVLGGKVGAGLPFTELGATPVFELELGFAPSLGESLGHSLEIFVIGQYAQPGLDGSPDSADPRLPGGEPFSYDVQQQMFSLALGGLYRFDVGSDLLMPYGGLGARMYMLNTHAEGKVGGEAFGESDETQMDFGLVLLGGVDVFVGPGALLAELSFGWAALDGFIMRDTNLGALSLSVGYRVML